MATPCIASPPICLVSDPSLPVAQVLQAYFYRWEIEVDQKDEKDLLGVGQAQVWSEVAVPRQPAFHVAAFAALLVAAVQAFGLNNPAPAGRLPLWRRRQPPRRLSVAHLLAHLRQEIEEYETLSSPNRRRRQRPQFRNDALGAHFGKKFPITTRALLSHAWT